MIQTAWCFGRSCPRYLVSRVSRPCLPPKPPEGTYFSMADTSLVLNLPLVSSSGVMRPSNRRPSLAIFTRISRTSSPMYMPLTIFSNLREGIPQVSAFKEATGGGGGKQKGPTACLKLPGSVVGKVSGSTMVLILDRVATQDDRRGRLPGGRELLGFRLG